MRFQVLGPVGVVANGRRVEIGRGQQRTILGVLLAAGGAAVSTARLVDALWDEPPASARKSLQAAVSRLRTRLGDARDSGSDPVVSTTDGYRVDLDGNEFDATEFAALVARGREALARAPERSTELFDQALALWRGPAWGDLASHPAVEAEAVRLEELRRAAAADHVDARLALGRHAEVIGELEATVRRDPLDERAHGQLMLALFRSGRQADALATHRRLREALREELGADPSSAVQDLQVRILDHDPELQAPSRSDGPASARGKPPPDQSATDRVSPDPRPTGAKPSVLVPELIGRDEDVAAVVGLLSSTPLVTLTGPGGVGKSRLAEQVAARVADEFEDGVAVGALAAVRDPDAVGGALVTALGIQPFGDRSLRDTLVSAIGERRLLLVLDNCEHVLDGLTPLVDATLGQCPNLAILATSREYLHLPGERVWPVAPLTVPPSSASPDEVAAAPAGQLFTMRAEAVDPSFSLTDGNAAAVAELCRRLDGLPLAIELAAARARALSPGDLVDRLDRRFSLLSGGGPRRDDQRHRTLGAVVAWSHDLLAPSEADLFDRLSVFAGTFSLDAVERVCAGDGVTESEVAGLLGELVDKSMVVVERDGEQVRYRLLDTLRDFGADRLAERGDTATHRRAHADHHLALAERLGPAARGPDEPAAVAAIDRVFDDLRAAHAWMLANGEVDGALRLPAVLGDFIFYRLRDELTTWARHACELPEAAGHPARAGALATAARGATIRGQCGLAREQATAALETAEPNSLAEAWAYDALASADLYEGHLDDAIAHADRHAEVARDLDEPTYRAFALLVRVLAHAYRGDHDAAVSGLRDLHTAADACENPTMQAFAQYTDGEVHLDRDPEHAAASLERAVELARAIDNRLVKGVALVSLASLLGRRGQHQRALGLFREVIAHWRRLGDYTHQLTTVRNLVELLVQAEANEPAAILHGAVTAGLAPSFGAEAERLDAAWAQLEDRLGVEAAAAAARRGRLNASRMAEVALTHLDTMLTTT